MPRGSVSEIDRLILVNALYFQGYWRWYYFESEKHTKEYDFHLLDGKSVKVPFMRSNLPFHSIGVFDDFKALRIEYRADNFCMYILLPDSMDGLAALAERVCSEPNFLKSHLCSKYVIRRSVNDGNLRVPKFKFSFEFEATDTLKKLGVTLPFEVGALSEMVDPPEEARELFVREIFQKAVIQVDEEGTTASAFMRSECGGGCPELPPKKVDFVADHPFMFLISRRDYWRRALPWSCSQSSPELMVYGC